RREESVLSAWLEVFRSGITKVHIQEIGITESIGQTTGYTLITQWNCLQVVLRIIGMLRIAQIVIDQCRCAVIRAKLPIIVDHGFKVIFTILFNFLGIFRLLLQYRLLHNKRSVRSTS